MIHHLSFRFRILALVLGVAIVPLVLSGAFAHGVMGSIMGWLLRCQPDLFE